MTSRGSRRAGGGEQTGWKAVYRPFYRAERLIVTCLSLFGGGTAPKVVDLRPRFEYHLYLTGARVLPGNARPTEVVRRSINEETSPDG